MNQDNKNRLFAAINKLLQQDLFLLQTESYEPSITAKLNCYLMEQFSPEWDVDHEYNRDIRQNDLIKRNLLTNEEMRPDIIIHRRGKYGQENNLMIIELKKDGAPNKSDKSKLCYMTSTECIYQYQYGIHINITHDRVRKICLFRNGEYDGELL